eukprot:gene1822-1991_t
MVPHIQPAGKWRYQTTKARTIDPNPDSPSFISGHLIFGSSRQELLIQADMANTTFPFQLDTGCSARYDMQIDMETAQNLGMKSHTSLLGRSSSGDGSFKVDYISYGTLSVQGHTRDLVIKVTPEQPMLFGLDAMILFGMTTDLPNQTYHAYLKNVATPSMKLHKFLKDLCLTEADLVPLSTLPPPREAFKMALEKGHSRRVVDLGSSTLSLIEKKMLL